MLVRTTSFVAFSMVLFAPSRPHFRSSPENQQSYNNNGLKNINLAPSVGAAKWAWSSQSVLSQETCHCLTSLESSLQSPQAGLIFS